MQTLEQNAFAVLFPAFDRLELSDSIKQFLSEGGCSVLIGETREEYVTRQMSGERKAKETPDGFRQFNEQVLSFSKNTLIAVDQEIAGICRLHDLVAPFPPIAELQTIPATEFEVLASKIAAAAKGLGVNCFLGPILDIVTGINPWLKGRTWSKNPQRISDISSAYIRGIQSRGIAAAAKHFPGYSHIELDPAINPDAVMTDSPESVKIGFIPFKDAVENGVEIIMTGPAIVDAIDSETPVSLSAEIIRMLKETLGFNGLVMTDDLDAKATLRGKTVGSAAVDALNAGSDLLLLSDTDDQIQTVAASIVDAISSGHLPEERLCEAADKVRSVAGKYSKK